MIEYSKIEYRVNIRSGCIKFAMNFSKTDPKFISCQSLYEADVCSLNILRKLSLESKSIGKKIIIHHRNVLGVHQAIYDKDIIPNIKRIMQKYPEDFV